MKYPKPSVPPHRPPRDTPKTLADLIYTRNKQESNKNMKKAPLLPKKDFMPVNEELPEFNACNSDAHPYDLIDQYTKGEYPYVSLMESTLSRVINMLRYNHVDYEVVNGPNTIYDFTEDDKIDLFIIFNGAIKFTWNGEDFVVIQIPGGRNVLDYSSMVDFVAGKNIDAVGKLIKEINDFSPSSENTILIYNGDFDRSTELRDQIRVCKWDDLILPEALKHDIRGNVEKFFKSREIYDRMGIPYKRGFLFVGEPGSGKSLCGKIIASTMNVNFIYVISLSSRNQTTSEGIDEVFERARKIAPCVILFEDLDTQIDLDSRTVFLNALDGFQANEGVLTIGTTNHPQNIDVALTNRPSRFDRKYVFPNPDKEQVYIYLTNRVKRLMQLETLPDEIMYTLDKLSKDLKKFSYAMLQELVVTAGHSWLLDEEKSLSDELIAAGKICQEQIKLGTGGKLQDAVDGEGRMGFST